MREGVAQGEACVRGGEAQGEAYVRAGEALLAQVGGCPAWTNAFSPIQARQLPPPHPYCLCQVRDGPAWAQRSASWLDPRPYTAPI